MSLSENKSLYKQIKIPKDCKKDRLDKILSSLMPQYSREKLKNWIKNNHIYVNGVTAKVRQIVNPHDIIYVNEQPLPETMSFKAEDIKINIVDEKQDWIIVNKSHGLVTHPGSGNWRGTLLNAILHRYPELSIVPRAGIVHRLDKNTSGLMVIARNEISQIHFIRNMQSRNILRIYIAIVHGHLPNFKTINMDIGRDRVSRIKMSVKNPIAGRNAITYCTAVRRGLINGYKVTQLICKLETGRTHQIRVHLSSIGHPVVGDILYGGKKILGLERQMLHACFLSFPDLDGKEQSFFIPPPGDILIALEAINTTIEAGGAGGI
ncbi:ribosomal large subunit pseudouridine synthase D [Candidatus Kinetoplastibacterium blastocrithidii TCC012E]|uniref:Pseudouridine synthase n=1 Tax=Candidatus Kinetoplastidibacterium blastocrithidiae TCC012E TaxID=1208922 RepID=M1LWF7_9PROT|nr:RluA family pseudouridine synthase [Candidatus Kinetoplastibacterium blastocrithidii]AFZ83739.1 23S rRNA pseudouridine1911/1915/1917 synthase [Candidatus Kinetoplastibacterium blastocrithidii (ex Strigomonas culicis)]AGF49862.1 ribosomal large subunit pseudouridine synthase D [Candidatus Kinetoplastibacterium blastocrithidii TCC012E]